MFALPDRYVTDSAIEPKQFILRDMKKPERERIRDNLLAARLVWQIKGEEIPSWIDDSYNCVVIMGLDMKLKAVKDSAFFSDCVQRIVKAPCVVRFYDNSEEVYSFAHKRLNRTDNTQVVIEHHVQTPPLSLMFPNRTSEQLRQYLAFDALLNKADKLSFYLEAAAKAFIISNPHLYGGVEYLLDKKLWYNRENVIVLLKKLLALARLNSELKAEKLPGERAKLITEVKTLTASIKGE